MVFRITILVVIGLGMGACTFQDSAPRAEETTSAWMTEFIDAVGDHRVVQLGESGHGMAETYQLKTQTVRHLHREHGFDLLAVEGGFAECWVAARQLAEWSPRASMKACFWDAWASDEAEALFQYLQAAASANRPLRLVGFDNAPTSRAFQDWLDGSPELPEALRRAETDFQVIMSGKLDDAEVLRAYQKRAQESYLDVVHELESPMLRAIVEDRLATLDFDASQFDWQTFERVRERRMAANLLHHLENNPTSRVIVWAHNAHIAHAYSQFVDSVERQGEIIHRALGRDAYSLGIYALEGRGYAWFMNDEYDLVTPPQDSLERRLATSDGDPVFLDFRDAPMPEYGWIHEPVMSLEWGLNPQEIVPSRMYDGVLLIRKVSPISRTDRSAED